MKALICKGTALVFVAFLAGCGMIPVNWGKLEGRVWCDVRYLDVVEDYQDYDAAGSDFRKRLQLSKSGYMFAVAAVLPLQSAGKELRFHFSKPDRLKEIVELRQNLRNGFDAMTFILHDKAGDPIQTVISFGGSNQLRDYLFHNLWIFPVQFDDARAYVHQVSRHAVAQRLPMIAVGASLGGGLAVHVKKDEGTAHLIKEAWAFNPSPRIGANHSKNPNIYLLANKYEILNRFGRGHLGAMPEHTATDFGLIRSSSIYGHYRWVLARQILHFADLALYFESGGSPVLTEPMRILQSQKISSEICTREMKNAISKERAAIRERSAAIE
ncbi:MAG: hypothetical protein M9951_06145 [Burkholderiaceae bacterium]|nr:hypothetical protein [Burkholderiaceae bacterium]